MNGDQWTRVKELFHAALERPPDERAAFLFWFTTASRSAKARGNLRGAVQLYRQLLTFGRK